jgi:hypothetical protein
VSVRHRLLTLLVSVGLIVAAAAGLGSSMAPGSSTSPASDAALDRWLVAASTRHTYVRSPSEQLNDGLTHRLRRAEAPNMLLVVAIPAWITSIGWMIALQRRRRRARAGAGYVASARAPPLQLA